MFHGLKKIYIFNSTGLQAYLTVTSKEDVEIKFLFDNETSLQGMAISARLLKILGISKTRPIFMQIGRIIAYLDKIMLIGVLEERSWAFKLQEIKRIMNLLHDYLASIDTDDVGSFIKNLVSFVRVHKFNNST